MQISHEALAREWPRLKEWLADDVEGQRIMRHLGSAAAAWDAMARPDSELYRGGRLTTAQHWRDTVGPALTALEREFLDASAANETAGLAASSRDSCAGCPGCRPAQPVSRSSRSRRASSRGSRRTSQGSVRRSQKHGASPRSRSRTRTSIARCCSPWRPSSSGTVPRHASTSYASSRRAPRLTSITRIQEDGVAAASMSLAEDGTRASVIDSDHDVRLFDLENEVAARRVLAVLQDGGDVGDRPRHWGGRVQRDIRPLWRSLRLPPNRNARCRRRGPLGREDLRGPGQDGGRRRVLGRRIPVRSARRVDGTRVARARRPLASRRGRPGAPGSGCQRFRPAARRGVRCGEVLAGRLATVRQRIRTDHRVRHGNGQELDRIAGNGILAVSPDGSRIAVRDGSFAVRIVDSSGVAPPITVPLSSFPSAADFSPDSRQTRHRRRHRRRGGEHRDRRDRGDAPRS